MGVGLQATPAFWADRWRRETRKVVAAADASTGPKLEGISPPEEERSGAGGEADSPERDRERSLDAGRIHAEPPAENVGVLRSQADVCSVSQGQQREAEA